MNSKKKQAIVLSGGGANGAFEVGVMKALFEGKSPATDFQPPTPDIYTGASVGCYNASFMVSRADFGGVEAIKELDDIWTNRIGGDPQQCGNGVFRFRGDPLDFLSPACLVNHPLQPFIQLMSDSRYLAAYGLGEAGKFATSSGSLVQRILNSFNLSAFVDIDRYRQLIRETIDFAKIRQSDKALRITSTNWKTGGLDCYGNTDMTEDLGFDIIRGSSAIPGVFPPAIIDGVRHVDSGVLLTTPLSGAIDAGGDTLHVIFLDPEVRNIPDDILQSTLGIFSRFYVILTAAQFRNDLARAASVNRGLELIELVARGESPSDEASSEFLELLEGVQKHMTGTSPSRKLTIHAYRPRDDLGGLIGLLDFRRERMIDLIRRGFQTAVEHDCKESECLIPG